MITSSTTLEPSNKSDTPPIAPSREEAERFLKQLDGNADSFCFLTFDDSKDKNHSLTRVFSGSLNDNFDKLAKLNEAGAGIFVTINAVIPGKRRSTKNIERVRAVFVDLDGAPLDPVLLFELAPNMIVESSSDRWHAYWFVSNCPLEDFKDTQRALAEKFDGDSAVNDLPRVMRLPGFLHQKDPANPFKTRIHSEQEVTI
jgi:putative DNA primase/helicase